jgi:hypothetical protein
VPRPPLDTFGNDGLSSPPRWGRFFRPARLGGLELCVFLRSNGNRAWTPPHERNLQCQDGLGRCQTEAVLILMGNVWRVPDTAYHPVKANSAEQGTLVSPFCNCGIMIPSMFAVRLLMTSACRDSTSRGCSIHLYEDPPQTASLRMQTGIGPHDRDCTRNPVVDPSCAVVGI